MLKQYVKFVCLKYRIYNTIGLLYHRRIQHSEQQTEFNYPNLITQTLFSVFSFSAHLEKKRKTVNFKCVRVILNVHNHTDLYANIFG